MRVFGQYCLGDSTGSCLLKPSSRLATSLTCGVSPGRHLALWTLLRQNLSFHAEEEGRLLKFDIEPELEGLEFAPARDGANTFLLFQILEEGTHADFSTKPRPSLRTGPTALPGTMIYVTERPLERWVGAGNTDVFHTGSSFR